MKEKERKTTTTTKNLGGKSFTRWLLGVSVRALAWTQGLMSKVFAFPLPDSAKRSIRDQVGLSVPTTYDCPRYSSCIQSSLSQFVQNWQKWQYCIQRI